MKDTFHPPAFFPVNGHPGRGALRILLIIRHFFSYILHSKKFWKKRKQADDSCRKKQHIEIRPPLRHENIHISKGTNKTHNDRGQPVIIPVSRNPDQHIHNRFSHFLRRHDIRGFQLFHGIKFSVHGGCLSPQKISVIENCISDKPPSCKHQDNRRNQKPEFHHWLPVPPLFPAHQHTDAEKENGAQAKPVSIVIRKRTDRKRQTKLHAKLSAPAILQSLAPAQQDPGGRKHRDGIHIHIGIDKHGSRQKTNHCRKQPRCPWLHHTLSDPQTQKSGQRAKNHIYHPCSDDRRHLRRREKHRYFSEDRADDIGGDWRKGVGDSPQFIPDLRISALRQCPMLHNILHDLISHVLIRRNVERLNNRPHQNKEKQCSQKENLRHIFFLFHSNILSFSFLYPFQ